MDANLYQRVLDLIGNGGPNGYRVSQSFKEELKLLNLIGFDTVNEKIWSIFNQIHVRPVCQTCNGSVKFRSFKLGFQQYCSAKCSASNQIVRAKCKNTVKARYGVDNVFQSDVIKKKSTQTLFERYGVNHQMLASAVVKRLQQTVQDRYGVAHPMHLAEVRQKVASTNIERYGVSTKLIDLKLLSKISNEKYGVSYTAQRFIQAALPFLNDEEWLSERYLIQKLSQEQLAEQLGVSRTTVGRALRDLAIPVRRIAGYSTQAICWLEYVKETQGVEIQHAQNGGEVMIPGTTYFADGFCHETNTVYEFHGDAFHGNPTRYQSNDRPHPFNKSLTAKQLYERTLFRECEIQKTGCTLITIWESDWKDLKLSISK